MARESSDQAKQKEAPIFCPLLSSFTLPQSVLPPALSRPRAGSRMA